MEVRWINDVYFKSAATDRSISVGCGYGNNDSVGYTNDKEITTAFQRAGNLLTNSIMIFSFKYFSCKSLQARSLFAQVPA